MVFLVFGEGLAARWHPCIENAQSNLIWLGWVKCCLGRMTSANWPSHWVTYTIFSRTIEFKGRFEISLYVRIHIIPTNPLKVIANKSVLDWTLSKIVVNKSLNALQTRKWTANLKFNKKFSHSNKQFDRTFFPIFLNIFPCHIYCTTTNRVRQCLIFHIFLFEFHSINKTQHIYRLLGTVNFLYSCHSRIASSVLEPKVHSTVYRLLYRCASQPISELGSKPVSWKSTKKNKTVLYEMYKVH